MPYRKSFFFYLIKIMFLHYNMYIRNAGMAELADAYDLGSYVNSCRFDPCYPHHKILGVYSQQRHDIVNDCRQKV